ncbi:MAG: cobyrinate a,c-diamide synthase [Methanoregula sp.]|jgi:cobyrinic acid a,c-diamide synthase|nr:cobyrinate a,c-diamide synthase [Methanoregula sp.]
MNSIPRIIIAGTHSGCGKTTIASGIMAALTARGMKVQPFKVGPDFIDPSHHTRICARPSRNLDPFMMGEEGCIETVIRATSGADIAVIEGVMGIYDGIDGTDVSSTAHVARILNTPVILVVDVKGMSRSVLALIRGFEDFDSTISFAGVILNRVGSHRHRQMIEGSLSLPSVGWIPKREDIAIESRHLGLKMAYETGLMGEFGKVIEEFCDLDAIIAISHKSPMLIPKKKILLPGKRKPVRATIGVALDDAFCFYYQDNLDRLRTFGAELVFFSPLKDPLPEVNALYFGGGYPELHLPALEISPCTRELKPAIDEGMPVYGECGGLLYLTREIRSDRKYRLCGVVPAESEMTSQVQALGYVKGEKIGEISFVPPLQSITGHEFHYSRVFPDHDAQFAFRLTRGKGIDSGKDGLSSVNALGTYTHAYFSDSFARIFVDAAYRFSND